MKFVILSISLVALFFANLFVGSVDIPPAQVVDILFNNGDPDDWVAIYRSGKPFAAGNYRSSCRRGADRVRTYAPDRFQQSSCRSFHTRHYIGVKSRSRVCDSFSEGQFLPQVILGADTRLYWQDRLQAVSRSWVCCSCFPCGLKMT